MSTRRKLGNIPEAPTQPPGIDPYEYKAPGFNQDPILETKVGGEFTWIRACRAASIKRHGAVCRYVSQQLCRMGFHEEYVEQMMLGAGELIPNGFKYGYRNTRVSINCFIFGQKPKRLIHLFVHNYVEPGKELMLPDDSQPIEMPDPLATAGRGFPILEIMSRGYATFVAQNYSFEGVAYFQEEDGIRDFS